MGLIERIWWKSSTVAELIIQFAPHETCERRKVDDILSRKLAGLQIPALAII